MLGQEEQSGVDRLDQYAWKILQEGWGKLLYSLKVILFPMLFWAHQKIEEP